MALLPACRQGAEDRSEPAARVGRARTADRVKRRPLRIAEKKPQVARAPVAGDELRSTHQCGSTARTRELRRSVATTSQLRKPSSIDQYRGAGHEPGVVGGKERDGRRDIRWRSHLCWINLLRAGLNGGT